MEIRWGFGGALIILFVAFLSMIFIAFDLSGLSFLLSLVLFFGLLGFGALSMSGVVGNRAWGWSFLGFESLLFLLYASFVYIGRGSLESLGTLIASSIVLLVLSLANFRLANSPKRGHPAPKVEVYDPMEKVEPSALRNVKKQFTPGKYVASKFGGTFHKATCEWANNIKRSNRVWFASEEEAGKARMKPHSCITG